MTFFWQLIALSIADPLINSVVKPPIRRTTSLTLVPARETIRYACFRGFKPRAQTKINTSPQDELQARIIFPPEPPEIALADSIKEFLYLLLCPLHV